MQKNIAKEILDAKRFLRALMQVRSRFPSPTASQEAAIRLEVLTVVRAAYEEASAAIRAGFIATNDGKRAVRQGAALMDLLITALFQFTGNYFYRHGRERLKSRLAVIAVGGYGRSELFPCSDIDILFLHENEGWEETSKIAEFILYILWDLGLHVGQSSRTADETIHWATGDATVCTNLLDARFLCGNALLAERMRSRYWNEVVTEKNTLSFVEAKLTERDERHLRAGDSRYTLEPKLKDGKGGLRDLHTLHWLARYVYRIDHTRDLVKLGVLSTAEYRAYVRAYKFLGNVRIYLHLLAGRAEERLTFDMQREIAARLGYRNRGETLAVERFMKAYFLTAKTVGDLTRVFCAVLEDERKRKRRLPFIGLLFNPAKLQGFIVENGRLAAPDEGFFMAEPTRLIRLFALAQRHELDIHPRTLRLVSRQLSLINPALRADPEANALFLDILTSTKQPDVALRRMNEAGVLGKFIPDFGRVVCQMQYDMYHVYTVDEHTIFALGILNQIALGQRVEDFPLASRLIHRIASKRVLCLAVLCHDIAKGRGGDHSMLGEKVALKLAERMGFDPEEVETAAWLVRQHLLFSHTAFKRDVTEEKTVADFAAKVQSLERLRLLLILTVVDIRAVSPHVWNSWKGALLRELYFRAEAFMGGAGETPGAPQPNEAFLPALAEALPEWTAEERASYMALGSEHYLSGMDMAAHMRIARLLKDLQRKRDFFAMEVVTDAKLSITELLMITHDRKGLFALIAGALTFIGANIVNAKIFTLKNGMAVEQFFVQDFQGEAFEKVEKFLKLEQTLRKALGQENTDIYAQIRIPARAMRTEAFRVKPRVIIENSVSSHHTVIEVKGRDRPGFLYTVTRALAELELGISTAHISSYGERAVDVFYVKDKFGMKIVNEGKLKQIKERLTQALTEENAKEKIPAS